MSLLSPGVKVGPYEIVSRLGAGGMGEVWRARDTRLERSVAIKVLAADLASNAQLRFRFEREAKGRNRDFRSGVDPVGDRIVRRRGRSAADPVRQQLACARLAIIALSIFATGICPRVPLSNKPLPLRFTRAPSSL